MAIVVNPVAAYLYARIPEIKVFPTPPFPVTAIFTLKDPWYHDIALLK